MCGLKATKKCGCGQDFCDRHYQMHSHPTGSGPAGTGAGIG